MNIKGIVMMLLTALCGVMASSCQDSVSYAEQLADERVATNYFLANQKVVNEIPADTIFEVGEDAPYYRLDEDGRVYMQVLSNTGLDQRPKVNEMVYFRYMRYDIISWCENGGEVSSAGNANDMSSSAVYFLYQNFTVGVSEEYGQGIQLPLQYVGVGSEVNLVIKSQLGPGNEIADVVPYHWHVRYYRSRM